MRSINGRISKLEHRFGTAHSAPRYLLILMNAGNELGPAEEAYIKALDECGFLHTSGFVAVDLTKIKSNSVRRPSITVELL